MFIHHSLIRTYKKEKCWEVCLADKKAYIYDYDDVRTVIRCLIHGTFPRGKKQHNIRKYIKELLDYQQYKEITGNKQKYKNKVRKHA